MPAANRPAPSHRRYIITTRAAVAANAVWSDGNPLSARWAIIVIWRFTGTRTVSETSERHAQRAVAISFFLLAAYIPVESIHRAPEAVQDLVFDAVADARTQLTGPRPPLETVTGTLWSLVRQPVTHHDDPERTPWTLTTIPSRVFESLVRPREFVMHKSIWDGRP
jgi:hypothetical protein